LIGRAARAQRRIEKRLEAAVGGEAEEAPPEPEPGPAPESEWLPIEGILLAVAVDGAGQHDGSGEYSVVVKMDEFNGKFKPGGLARSQM